MAQIIPPITSLPRDSDAAPSVEDIQDRLPSICVDYLSHNWTEEDVWASWRNMTRHKHEIANGVRLENASWRTWNKQRNKLRTISPETLNWLKDSDVTWLYGPLHTAKVEPVRPLKISSTEDRVGLDLPAAHSKPGILKHRTLTELLSLPGPTSPDVEDGEEDGEAADYVSGGARPAGLAHTKSESNLYRSNSMPARPNRNRGGLARAGSVRTASSSRSKEPSPEGLQNNRRHITFNTFVEQCISLDEPNLSIQQQVADDSEDDDMVEMRSTLSRFSSGRRSSSISSTQSHTSMTIKMIAPTVLKTAGSYTNNPAVPQTVHRPPPEYMPQEQQQQQPAAPAIPTSPFGNSSPLSQVGANAQRWQSSVDDDDYNFNYFGGPHDTGSSPKVGTYGRAPAVQPPPAQPKWRQAQTVEIGGSPSSSSSSSSLNAAISVSGGASSPQPPSRGILKVRAAPAASQQIPEPVSPPAIFNYNPSVATGIGGMYGSYENAQLAIGSPTHSAEEPAHRGRGRSTSRGYGSSQYDRSVARGSSTSSAGSSVGSVGSGSGSVSRSPVDTTGKGPRSQQLAGGYDGEPMDVDASPDRSSTPTPHSSPQIVFRPLKDTSPASLPHTSTRPSSSSNATAPGLVPDVSVNNNNSGSGSSGATSSGGLGPSPNLVDSPTSVSPKATIRDVRAELSQPSTASGNASDGDDDDGSTLIGRATNIANTAKDLLGALWYGSQDDPRVARPSARQHRRGASLG